LVICEGMKRNINKYGDEIQTFNNKVTRYSADKVVISDNSDRVSIEGLDKKKSSIINFYFSIEWFKTLGFSTTSRWYTLR